MLGNIPIPKGSTLDWVKSEHRGEGHQTKQTIIQETADLANKTLASYALYIEGPDTPGPEHRAQFKADIETYGKRAVEPRRFAQQSNSPQPANSDVALMLSAQGSLANRNTETTTAAELLDELLWSLGLSPDVIEFDPRATLDNLFNRIDDELCLTYYATLEQVVNNSSSTPSARRSTIRSSTNWGCRWRLR